MKRNKFWDFIKDLFETVFTVLILVILIRSFIGEPRWIPSASMRPTLMEGDRVFVEKISNFISEPQRGDIIVFYPPFENLEKTPWAIFTRLSGLFNDDIAYIKRIIGMPGDTIKIKTDYKTGESLVYINGKLIDEKYKYDNKSIACKPDMYCGPLKVPADSYFMMGDNRANSQDSRFWGFLKKDRIVGRAKFKFWPIGRIGVINAPEYNVDSSSKKEPTSENN